MPDGKNPVMAIMRQVPRGKSAWPIRSIAGTDFHVIPGSYFKKLFGVGPAALDFEDDAEHLLPVVAPDNGLEFPANPDLEDAGLIVRAGIASHGVDPAKRNLPATLSFDAPLPGFSALALATEMPDGFDWYAACMKVITAHGWADGGGPTDKVLRIVAEAEPEWFADLTAREDEHWPLLVYEKAATYTVTPLSRLWYAANMLSLYYVHEEDILVGFLWSEYRMRLRYEQPALRHLGVVEKNRENGLKGGQGDKKQERYRTLNGLAISRLNDIAFVSDGEAARSARRWAADYDKGVAEPLFLERGKPLSRAWYDEWLAQFRPIARKMMQAAQ